MPAPTRPAPYGALAVRQRLDYVSFKVLTRSDRALSNPPALLTPSIKMRSKAVYPPPANRKLNAFAAGTEDETEPLACVTGHQKTASGLRRTHLPPF
jgi:hypothetical protein